MLGGRGERGEGREGGVLGNADREGVQPTPATSPRPDPAPPLQVFAWLMRLNGKQELADSIELVLEQVTTSKRSSRPRSGQQQQQQQLSRVNSKGKKVFLPTPPPPAACIPRCTNVLKGAEAAKKAAQGLGLSTEFAPVNAVATGYGRAVCALLQDALELTRKRLLVAVREPQRPVREAGQARGRRPGGRAQRCF